MFETSYLDLFRVLGTQGPKTTSKNLQLTTTIIYLFIFFRHNESAKLLRMVEMAKFLVLGKIGIGDA
jgi:hypothetical protein